ncbi:hypothetical protein J7L48_07310 [bacterium]|nr:hypothetical protein [bacterium]
MTVGIQIAKINKRRKNNSWYSYYDGKGILRIPDHPLFEKYMYLTFSVGLRFWGKKPFGYYKENSYFPGYFCLHKKNPRNI